MFHASTERLHLSTSMEFIHKHLNSITYFFATIIIIGNSSYRAHIIQHQQELGGRFPQF